MDAFGTQDAQDARTSQCGSVGGSPSSLAGMFVAPTDPTIYAAYRLEAPPADRQAEVLVPAKAFRFDSCPQQYPITSRVSIAKPEAQ